MTFYTVFIIIFYTKAILLMKKYNIDINHEVKISKNVVLNKGTTAKLKTSKNKVV